MTTYTLTLTDEQAEILGYALTYARRYAKAQADTYDREGRLTAAEGSRERAARIEELRELLDVCPVA